MCAAWILLGCLYCDLGVLGIFFHMSRLEIHTVIEIAHRLDLFMPSLIVYVVAALMVFVACLICNMPRRFAVLIIGR